MKFSTTQQEDLLNILKTRFEKNMGRHADLSWNDVEKRLKAKDAAKKLWSLNEMERTGGEPDVIGQDKNSGEFIFCDCAPESPKGRRSLCYDPEALESRKKFKPTHSAVGMAAEMGIEILSESGYLELQKLGDFDLKTSSWVKTPDEIRSLGGALFGDKRFERSFIYHNGAESYYAARGFRGLLKI